MQNPNKQGKVKNFLCQTVPEVNIYASVDLTVIILLLLSVGATFCLQLIHNARAGLLTSYNCGLTSMATTEV